MKFFVHSNSGFLSYSVMERQLRAQLEYRQLFDYKGLTIRFGHLGMINADILITTWETTKIPRGWLKFAKNYKLIIVGSKWNLDIFKSAGILNVICIPFGIDNDYFDRRCDVPVRAETLLFFANNQKRKGLDVLEALWVKYFEKSPLNLIIVGRNINFLSITKGKSKLQDRFLVTDYGDNITLYEPIETLSAKDIQRFYFNAKTVVIPSRSEGYGLTVLEALSCGCNVVLPDYSSTREFVFNGCFKFSGLPTRESGAELGFGINGLWWEPDQASLAKAIYRSMDSGAQEDPIKRMNLQASIESTYSWDCFIDSLLEYFDNMGYVHHGRTLKSISKSTIVFRKIKFKLRRFCYGFSAIRWVVSYFE